MILSKVTVDGDNEAMMHETLRLIGKAIRTGSRDLDIRNLAARIASTAPPKDYLGQVKAIYDWVTRHWRYVKDPVTRELLSYSPKVLLKLVLGADGKGAGEGFGVGDCDCISAGLGALLESVGFPVRLGTTMRPGAPVGGTFGHVFPLTYLPKQGWISVDPVLYPKQPMGAVAAHSRLAIWDLHGRLVRAKGNYRRRGNTAKKKEVRLCTEVINKGGRTFKQCRPMMDY